MLVPFPRRFENTVPQNDAQQAPLAVDDRQPEVILLVENGVEILERVLRRHGDDFADHQVAELLVGRRQQQVTQAQDARKPAVRRQHIDILNVVARIPVAISPQVVDHPGGRPIPAVGQVILRHQAAGRVVRIRHQLARLAGLLRRHPVQDRGRGVFRNIAQHVGPLVVRQQFDDLRGVLRFEVFDHTGRLRIRKVEDHRRGLAGGERLEKQLSFLLVQPRHRASRFGRLERFEIAFELSRPARLEHFSDHIPGVHIRRKTVIPVWAPLPVRSPPKSL